ncbi:MAG: transporter, family, 3-phenylpropionic acid transporter [Candidatus Atribacteria bacterium]|nr:transporter, family, 3-phenylpropionic acid transporter [Candidatus Atribacteria bacterium]
MSRTNFYLFLAIAGVSNLTFSMNSMLFSLFAQKVGYSSPETGLLISILAIGSLVGGPVWGRITDCWEHRKLLISLSLLGQGLFSFLTPLISQIEWLTIARFFLGFFLVAQAPILNQLMVNVADIEERSYKISLLNITRAIAFSLGCLLSGISIEIQPALNFYLPGTMAFVTFFLSLFLKEVDQLITFSQEENFAPSHSFLLLDKNLVWFFLPIFLRACGINGLNFFVSLFWETQGQSSSFSGLVFAVANFFQWIFFPLVSRKCSRSEVKNIQAISVGYFLSVFPFLILPFLGKGWILLLPQSLISISFAYFYLGSTMSIRFIVAPHRQTEAMGWIETSINLGGTTGPLLFSILLAVFQQNFPPVIFIFSLFPISALVTFLFRRKSFLPAEKESSI